MINLLVAELDRQAPAGLRADREMTVRLAKRQAPEPDVVVVTAEAYDRDAMVATAVGTVGVTAAGRLALRMTSSTGRSGGPGLV